MTYDDWKTQTPWEDEMENECSFCGTPCDKTFCSKECYLAEIND